MLGHTLLLAPALLAAACSSQTTESRGGAPAAHRDASSDTAPGTASRGGDARGGAPPDMTSLLLDLADTSAFTHQRADGNRVAGGSAGVADGRGVDIALPDQPVWVVGIAHGDGAVWAVALESGTVLAYPVDATGAVGATRTFGELPPGTPLTLNVRGGEGRLLYNPGAAPLSAAARTETMLAFAGPGGEAIVTSGHDDWRFSLGTLPDARLVVDEDGIFYVLGGATKRYPHGILGDDIEATRLTLLRSSGNIDVIEAQYDVAPGWVFEAITPLVADLDGDGVVEVILTESNATEGARYVAFTRDGERWQSPSIGVGQRWRHAIAVEHLLPDGGIALVGVRTPHIGGPVEYLSLRDGTLVVVAEAALPFTSHEIGSRNLDRALVADGDGDGTKELILPSTDGRDIAGVDATATGAAVAWSRPLPGRLRSNLSAVHLASGRVALGAAHDGPGLRVFMP